MAAFEYKSYSPKIYIIFLDPYSAHEPIYQFHENSAQLVRTTITLPGGIDDSLRQHQGQQFWRTEKAARRDAATSSITEDDRAVA